MEELEQILQKRLHKLYFVSAEDDWAINKVHNAQSYVQNIGYAENVVF